MDVELRRDPYALALVVVFAWAGTFISVASNAIAEDIKLTINPDLASPKTFEATEDLKLELDPEYKPRAIGSRAISRQCSGRLERS